MANPLLPCTRLGQIFEQDWISEIELNLVEHDDLKDMGMSKDECKVFKKTNEERVEMCRIRAKANQNPADVGDNGKLLESKTQNEQLKNELWRLKEFTKDRETMKNDLKTLKETQSDIKKSIEDLKNKVMSQNQNKTQNVQGIGSNNDSTNAANEEQNSFCFEQPVKKIKMEDQNGEIQRLTQIIKDLKDDNSKLSTEIAKLSQHNEEMQNQNEATIKNLKEDRLKLAREVVELKYGHGSKNSSF